MSGGIASLTMRELLRVEQAAKVKVGVLGDASKLGARELAAVAWVIRLREDPDFTFDQALELTMAEVNATINDGAAADPTPPGTPNDSES